LTEGLSQLFGLIEYNEVSTEFAVYYAFPYLVSAIAFTGVFPFLFKFIKLTKDAYNDPIEMSRISDSLMQANLSP
jgi:hypothetical protein